MVFATDSTQNLCQIIFQGPSFDYFRWRQYALCWAVSERAGWDSELLSMMVIDIMGITKIVTLIRMVTKQLEKEGARPTLLDPLEVDAPLLAQPLHFMVSFIMVLVSAYDAKHTAFWSVECISTSLQKDQSQAPQWMLDTHKVIQESQG